MREVARRLGLVGLGILLALGLLEGGLRVTAWVFLWMRHRNDPPAVSQPNHRRILCLGESTTADLDLVLMGMGKGSYPAQLQRTLNERAPGIHFDVINGGVPATTTDLILANLPANLDEYRPDVVVAMMGINDGESPDSAFQIGGSLRVWKLAKMIYFAWWDPSAANADKYGPTPPDTLQLRGWVAWERVLAGQNGEGMELLQPILEQDQWLVAKTRAHGIMAIASWQQGQTREGERYRRRFIELYRSIPRSKTIRNYRELRRILAERHIPLVAVQYPGLPVAMLVAITENDPELILVDNEETFLEPTRTGPAKELYRDLFAGIFGHLTPRANAMLAENVATGVLEALGLSSDGTHAVAGQSRN